MRPPGFPALLCLVGWCVTLFGNGWVSWSKAHRRFDGGGPIRVTHHPDGLLHRRWSNRPALTGSGPCVCLRPSRWPGSAFQGGASRFSGMVRYLGVRGASLSGSASHGSTWLPPRLSGHVLSYKGARPSPLWRLFVTGPDCAEVCQVRRKACVRQGHRPIRRYGGRILRRG